MAHEFTIKLLVEDKELADSIEEYLADKGEPDAKVTLPLAAIARDLQMNAYEDGSMHGHFNVVDHVEGVDQAAWFATHFPTDAE